MKKLSLIIAIAITSLNAEMIQSFTNPLGSAFKSTDNGGTLPAIDAYKDGVGVIVLDNLGIGVNVDNSAMNTLVYKYGEAAKASGSTIVNQVLATSTAPIEDKNLVQKINNSNGVVSPKTFTESIPATFGIVQKMPFGVGYTYGWCGSQAATAIGNVPFVISCGGSYADPQLTKCDPGFSLNFGGLVKINYVWQNVYTCSSDEPQYSCTSGYNLNTTLNTCNRDYIGCDSGYIYDSIQNTCTLT